MAKSIFKICLFVLIFTFPNSFQAQTQTEKQEAIRKTKKIASELAKNSYSELNFKRVVIKTFKGKSSFFKARFSFGRFLMFRKMRHILYVNPEIFKRNAPEKAVRAILAHELAHILYFTKKNRFELLGLVGLASGSFTAKFERRTDLEAIKRGYGEGLIEYRKWLYKNIPSKSVKTKRKNYFSPEEIALILEITKEKPKMFEVWRKKIPRNLDEIKKSIE